MFTAEPKELLSWCRGGEVIDAKTLIGALWLQNVLSGEWVLEWQAVGASPAGDAA